MTMTMTPEEFKKLWESYKPVTLSDIDECAKAWGLFTSPSSYPTHVVTYKVLKAAGVEDADAYKPEESEE